MKKNCGLSGIRANQIQDTHFHSSWSIARIVPFNIYGLMNGLMNGLMSSMGQDRLSRMALMHIHYGMEIDYEQVITMFATNCQKTKMQNDATRPLSFKRTNNSVVTIMLLLLLSSSTKI